MFGGGSKCIPGEEMAASSLSEVSGRWRVDLASSSKVRSEVSGRWRVDLGLGVGSGGEGDRSGGQISPRGLGRAAVTSTWSHVKSANEWFIAERNET